MDFKELKNSGNIVKTEVREDVNGDGLIVDRKKYDPDTGDEYITSDFYLKDNLRAEKKTLEARLDSVNELLKEFKAAKPE